MKFDKYVSAMSQQRKLNRIKEQESELIITALTRVEERYMDELAREVKKLHPDYKEVYKKYAAVWRDEVVYLNKTVAHYIVTEKQFELWVWRMLKYYNGLKKLTPETRSKMLCMRRSVGRWWRLKMWLNDLQNKN